VDVRAVELPESNEFEEFGDAEDQGLEDSEELNVIEEPMENPTAQV